MFECFLEIGFEAELNTEESPELLELAYELCNEDPATRGTAIEELRSMIYQKGECNPLRTDDAFLLRYLRATKFIVPRAHRLLFRYCTFREEYPYLYKDVDLWGLAKAKNSYEGTIFDHPDVGRLLNFRFGVWDPSECPVVDLIRAGLLIMEIGVRQPKLQVLGGTFIVDMEGLTLRHVATLTPTVANQIVCLMGAAFPCHVRTCHIINYSWILNTFFHIFKRFIPRHAWDRIFFHGCDLKSLQKHIPLACLPPKYGGTCRYTSDFAKWLGKVKKYRTKEFDEDMKQLGYKVKE